MMWLSYSIVVLLLLAFSIPWWGLTLVALGMGVMGGNLILVTVCAFIADCIYGPPVGIFHVITLPLTLSVLILFSLRHFILKGMRQTNQGWL